MRASSRSSAQCRVSFAERHNVVLVPATIQIAFNISFVSGQCGKVAMNGYETAMERQCPFFDEDANAFECFRSALFVAV
jgi:hypothetical protein